MRRLLAWFYCCAMMVALCFVPVFASADALQVVQGGTSDGMMRVWLSSIKGNTTYSFSVEGVYAINGTTLSSGSSVKIDFSDGAVYATYNGNRMAMGTSATLARQSGGVKLAESLAPGNLYPGEFRFFYSGGTPYVVCHVHIEDYVYGVLPYEMDNSFPLEALKAQAVAARTYAMFCKTSGGSYDVTDTASHQVFRGVNSARTRCIQAADETRGMVMKYNGSYIEASFSASNGGQTETRTNAWGSSRVAYQAIKDDPYDLANPSSVAKSYLIYATPQHGSSPSAYTLIQNALAARLGGTAANYAINEVLDVSMHTPKYAAPSRVYTQMRVSVRYNGMQSIELDIPIFSTVKLGLGVGINSANNELFTVLREPSGFRVVSRRFGHGIGMSQRGAQQMANEGLSFRDILGFYYEGVQLTQNNYTSSWAVSVPTGNTVGQQTPPSQSQSTENAPSSGEYTTRVTLASSSARLNLRRTANLFGQVIDSIPNGESVTVLGVEDTWAKVRYSGQVGYVALEYLESTQQSAGSSTSGTGSGGARVTLQSGMLNLRETASKTGQILDSIPNNIYITLLERGGEWSRVQYNGKTGYVMTQFLTTDQDALPSTMGESQGTATVSLSNTNEILNLRMAATVSSTALAQLRHGTTLTVLEKGAEWSRVRYNDTVGYVMNRYVAFSGTAVQDTPAAMGGTQTRAYVNVASGKLNLRAEPSLSVGILASLENRTEVTVTALGDTWCAVTTAGGTSGHVMRAYLTMDAAAGTGTGQASASAAGSARVKTAYGGNVNIRSAASAQSAILGTAANGDVVTVLERGDQWTRVECNGTTGYISSAYVSSVAQQQDAATGTQTQTAGSVPTQAASSTRAWVKTTYGGGVNVRNEPSIYGTVLGSAPYGAEVEVLAQNGQWTYVQYGSVAGYIAAEYLTTQQQTASSAYDSAPPSSAGVASSPGGALTSVTAYNVSDSGSNVSPLPEGYVAPEQPESVIAWVETEYGGGVNLRSDASVSGAVLGTVPSGAQVRVLDASGEWTRVLYDGSEGYIASDYISYERYE